MTSMEQIELISVEARKLGLKYGEYVEKYGHTLPKPKPKKAKRKTGYIEGDGKVGHRPLIECICTVCGKRFMAGRKDSKYCPECARKRASECTKRCQEKKKNEKEKKNELEDSEH